ncbi:type I methionyl aminopeptidase [Candidatus Daviesbacteria bacterium RIFCSPLOWO2_01_FULL_38_10]|nr:MAG: type I methionyl aminopeptidase [Candidatus Daviesbacteria bacterium RIFCSPLOWO2_01_FULL_38_10]
MRSMVRNSYELKLMRKSGRTAAAALKKSLEAIKVGISELEADKVAEQEIYKLGGDLSYKTVPGYKFATCITVNEQVVHGIPTDRKFVGTDLVSVDLAVVYKGWHTDCAWTILLEKNAEKEKFLKAGEEALWDGIAQAIEGNRVGDISNAIQAKVEDSGYSVVRSLVGHGVGRSLHEPPEIPGFGAKGSGVALKSGMTLAIEVIYAKGSSEVLLSKDGWTYEALDKSWGGLFEMTVIVGRNKPEILTNF